MGTVTIHAGMMKTGSTSIQSWLRHNAVGLSNEYGIQLLCDSDPSLGRPGRLVPFDNHRIGAATAIALGYGAAVMSEQPDESVRKLFSEFFGSMGDFAGDEGSVIVSSEALGTPVLGGDPRMLDAMEELARRHRVRCVLYVRRQDLAIESRWRQWGFQHELSPSEWVRTQYEDLRYTAGLDRAESGAPSVEFLVRPFDRGLLYRGDVVLDFAHEVLGVTGFDPDIALGENPTTPLDLAMMLRAAPDSLTKTPGSAERGFDPGVRLVTLGRVAAEWSVADSPDAIASRELLQAVAHEEFETDNRRLIDRFGWPTTAFVPATDTHRSIEELDHLWEVEATPALDRLFAVLEQVCRHREERVR